MANTFDNHAGSIVSWLETTGQTMSADPTKRKWCVLSLTDLDPATINKYFGRETPNSSYETEYNAGKLTNNPIVHNQIESDMLYGLTKAFMLRHQDRLSSYRDDCEQKDHRVSTAINHGRAKLEHQINLTTGAA